MVTWVREAGVLDSGLGYNSVHLLIWIGKGYK